MKHKPLQKYVLLKVEDEEPKGSIIIPTQYKKKQPIGEVLQIGDFVTQCKVGDTIYFKKSGSKLINKEKGLVLCPEWNIICDYDWFINAVKDK